MELGPDESTSTLSFVMMEGTSLVNDTVLSKIPCSTSNILAHGPVAWLGDTGRLLVQQLKHLHVLSDTVLMRCGAVQ